MEITGISKSIDMERLTSKRATLLGIGTWQYVKDVFYVNLSQNRRKVKVKGVYVDVINIYVRNSFTRPGDPSNPGKSVKKPNTTE